MANVSFLYGLQANLNKLTSYTEGAFYLTSDTDRLYFAQSGSELVRLNKHVEVKDNIETILKISDAAEGDLYYAKAENILCIRKDNQWFQINRNTNTESYIKTISEEVITTGNVGEATAGIQVTLNFDQGRYDQITGDEIGTESAPDDSLGATDKSISFTITGEDIYKVIHKPEVDVKASVSNKIATISTSGHGSSGDGFTVKGEDGITIKTNNSDGFIIDGTTYHLSNMTGDDDLTPASHIKLKDSDGNEESVSFTVDGNRAAAGTNGNNLIITPTANSIDISHTTVTPNVTNATALTGNTYGKTFNYITGPTFDKGGHVTGYTASSIQLPQEQNFELQSISADNTGKLTVAIKDTSVNSNGNESSATSETAVLYYTVGKDAPYKKTVVNQGDLDVYTTAEVDKLMQGVNAMRYRGTVSKKEDLPTTGVRIGDTYKISAPGRFDIYLGGELQENYICETGDLLIAMGNELSPDFGEDDDGFLSDVRWSYVPSGDDTDTKYTYVASRVEENNKTFMDTSITDSVNGDTQVVRFGAGEKIVIDGTSTTSGDKGVVTYSHATIQTEKTNEALSVVQTPAKAVKLQPTNTIKVLTNLTDDGYGHITKIAHTEYTLPDERDYSLTRDTTTINLIQKDDVNENENVGSVNFKVGTSNDSLTVTGSTEQEKEVITYSHKSFGAVTSTSEGTASFTAGNDPQLTVVTGVVTDNGHLTGLKTKLVKVPTIEVSDYVINASATNQEATITHTLTQTNSNMNTILDSYKLKTQTPSLQFAATANSATEDAVVSINLVWQSF